MRFIAADEMPEEAADIAKLHIDFPRLVPDDPSGCPVAVADVVEYLQMESPDADHIEARHLVFLRTARVQQTDYWIWAFTEPDGAECFVTVAVTPEAEEVIGYDENYFGLTPEQYILGEYHQVL